MYTCVNFEKQKVHSIKQLSSSSVGLEANKWLNEGFLDYFSPHVHGGGLQRVLGK